MIKKNNQIKLLVGGIFLLLFLYASDCSAAGAANGSYTSLVHDTGLESEYTTVSIATTTPANTSISVKIRSCDDASCSGEDTSKDWSVCNEVFSGQDISSNNCVEDGDRWVQYYAYLSTTDGDYVPSLDGVRIGYLGYATTSQELISSPFNALDPYNVITQIYWTETATSSGVTRVQIRSAATEAGLSSAAWCGPDDGTPGSCSSDTYFTASSGTEIIDDVFQDKKDDQWFQYKLLLQSETSTSTPNLEDITIQFIDVTPPVLNITNTYKGYNISSSFVPAFTTNDTQGFFEPICSFDNFVTMSACTSDVTTVGIINGWSSISQGSDITFYVRDTDFAGNIGTTSQPFSKVYTSNSPIEFTSVIDTGGTGDFSDLSSWAESVQSNLMATSTLVFSIISSVDVMPIDSSVIGENSGARGTAIVSYSSNQILIKDISGTFTDGEKVYFDGVGPGSFYVVLSSAGNKAYAGAKCKATTGVQDTSAVNLSGWTTGGSNYIRIYSDSSYRHSGVWDSSKYTLSVTAAADDAYVIQINDNYVRIEGLQIEIINNGYAGANAIYVNSIDFNNHIQFYKNILRSTETTNPSFAYSNNDLETNIIVSNNVIYDFALGGALGTSTDAEPNSAFYYNNTIYNTGFGIFGTTTVTAQNNVVAGSGDEFYGTFANLSYNATDDYTGDGTYWTDISPASEHRGHQAAFGDYQNRDFSVKDKASVLYDAGTAISFITDDIIGNGRPTGYYYTAGDKYDIGAFELSTPPAKYQFDTDYMKFEGHIKFE